MELTAGRYRARWLRMLPDSDALSDALALRRCSFRAQTDATEAASDVDAFDWTAAHLLVEEVRTGALAACCRAIDFADGREIDGSYSALRYDISALRGFRKPMMEIGRFCARPGLDDPEALRLAWAALAQRAEARGVAMLFGCSSFGGVDPEPLAEPFALLTARHIAPRRWRPRIKGPNTFPFARRFRLYTPDPLKALRLMPPLLRSYLAMGGRVSDHAVIDRDLDTLHVFTGLEVARIPKARLARLRGMAGLA